MSDNLDVLLTQLQELVENGKRFGRQRLLDPLQLQEMLEAVRAALPNTIERAKEIVAKRSEILEKASAEAAAKLADARQNAEVTEAAANTRVQGVVQHAKERVLELRAEGDAALAEARAEAAQLVDEHQINQQARAQAEQTLRQAEQSAAQIESDCRTRVEHAIAEAQQYSQNLIRSTEGWAVQYTGSVRSVVDEIVTDAEGQLAKALSDIRETQQRLQSTMNKSAAPPEFYAPEEPVF